MNKIGIICAMNSEVQLLLKNMVKQSIVEVGKIKFWVGEIAGKQVVLAVSGVGKVTAAITTQVLIDTFLVEGVINCGIAGGLDKRLKQLDVVISQSVTYHDFSARFMINYFPFASAFEADKTLVKIAASVCSDAYIGVVATGDSFIDSVEKKLNALNRVPDALCVEMEGGAIGEACFINQTPFVVIRCISDSANNRATADYNAFEVLSANKVAGIVIKMLKLI